MNYLDVLKLLTGGVFTFFCLKRVHFENAMWWKPKYNLNNLDWAFREVFFLKGACLDRLAIYSVPVLLSISRYQTSNITCLIWHTVEFWTLFFKFYLYYLLLKVQLILISDPVSPWDFNLNFWVFVFPCASVVYVFQLLFLYFKKKTIAPLVTQTNKVKVEVSELWVKGSISGSPLPIWMVDAFLEPSMQKESTRSSQIYITSNIIQS